MASTSSLLSNTTFAKENVVRLFHWQFSNVHIQNNDFFWHVRPDSGISELLEPWMTDDATSRTCWTMKQVTASRSVVEWRERVRWGAHKGADQRTLWCCSPIHYPTQESVSVGLDQCDACQAVIHSFELTQVLPWSNTEESHCKIREPCIAWQWKVHCNTPFHSEQTFQHVKSSQLHAQWRIAFTGYDLDLLGCTLVEFRAHSWDSVPAGSETCEVHASTNIFILKPRQINLMSTIHE